MCSITNFVFPFTNDCTSFSESVKIAKFADDTTIIVDLISNNDESVYIEVICDLTTWFDNNNLLLNPTKTKEMIIDFHKNKVNNGPVTINDVDIDIIEPFKF